jgi:hypothetical protein
MKEYNLSKLRKRPGMVIDPDAAKTPISIRLEGTVLAELRKVINPLSILLADF